MLTAARLRDLIEYDLSTGDFRWKSPRRKVRVGSVAGCYSYVGRDKRPVWYICIDGKKYIASRLAWLWMTGQWPEQEIDHINGDQANNAWGNLREASRSENARNVAVRRDNALGVRGVYFEKQRQKYRASIFKDGKRIACGFYETVDDAARAVNAARTVHHGEFARHSAN